MTRAAAKNYDASLAASLGGPRVNIRPNKWYSALAKHI